MKPVVSTVQHSFLVGVLVTAFLCLNISPPTGVRADNNGSGSPTGNQEIGNNNTISVPSCTVSVGAQVTVLVTVTVGTAP